MLRRLGAMGRVARGLAQGLARGLARVSVLHLVLALLLLCALLRAAPCVERFDQKLWSACCKRCSKANSAQKKGCQQQCKDAYGRSCGKAKRGGGDGDDDGKDRDGDDDDDEPDEPQNKKSRGGGGGQGKRATYHYYDEDAMPTPEVGGVYCTDALKSQWSSLKKKRGQWLAYCAGGSPPCGKTVTITNTATGAQAKGIVVDQCGFDGVDLAKPLFDKLDTDGQGYARGHMTVSVR